MASPNWTGRAGWLGGRDHLNQRDQAGETTSIPACAAAEQSRTSWATRAVRPVFTDKALAR